MAEPQPQSTGLDSQAVQPPATTADHHAANPPAPEPQTPGPGEQTQPQETEQMKKNRLVGDVARVGQALIFRGAIEGHDLVKELPNKPPEYQQEFNTKHKRGIEALHSIEQLDDMMRKKKVGAGGSFTEDDMREHPIKVPVTNKSGEQYTIQSLMLQADGTFLCKGFKEPRPGFAREYADDLVVDGNALLTGVLFSEEEAILAQFKDGSREKRLLELHLAALKGDTSGFDGNLDDIQLQMREAATEIGMLRREMVESFIKNLQGESLIAQLVKEGDTNEYRERKIAELKALAIAQLGPDEFVSPQQMMSVLGMLGLSEEGFREQAQARKDNIEILNARIEDMKKDKRHEAQVEVKKYAEKAAALEIEAELLEAHATLLGKDSPLIQLFAGMNSGTLEIEQAKHMSEAFAQGNLNAFMEQAVHAVGIAKGLTGKEREERIAKVKEQLLKEKKVPGGLLWILLLAMVKEVGGAAGGVVGLEQQ